MEGKLKFVRSGGALFVGTVEGCSTILHNPRMVGSVKDKKGEDAIQLVACLGNPETITLGAYDYTYWGNDENFFNFYKETLKSEEGCPD
jgi:hypothetical protein